MTKNPTTIQGVLNIDKPPEYTSHDVVQRVRRCFNLKRVGHTGTLDPFATGVLIVALGPATRLIEYATNVTKTYQAEVVLGATSTTDDLTGTITPTTSPITPPTTAEITTALHTFLGRGEQTPPAFAAVKQAGKKLYEYARNGQLDEARKIAQGKRRPIHIHELVLEKYHYPTALITVTCSTGTYIRSLARDLGEKLSTGAYVSSLRRTRNGPFTINQALTLDELQTPLPPTKILPAELLAASLPAITIPPQNVAQLIHGQSVEWGAPTTPRHTPLRLYTTNHTLIGVGSYNGTQLSPRKIIATTP